MEMKGKLSVKMEQEIVRDAIHCEGSTLPNITSHFSPQCSTGCWADLILECLDNNQKQAEH